MTGQLGFWSVEERLGELSAQGDPLETLATTVDFEMFRPVLARALGEVPRWKGGRPGFDPVPGFRMLVLQSLHGLSLEATGCPGGATGCRGCAFAGWVPATRSLRQRALGLPRGADPRGRVRRVVREARPGDHGGGPPAARRPDRRRHPQRRVGGSPRGKKRRRWRSAAARSRSGQRSPRRRVRGTSRRAGRRSAPGRRRGPTAPRTRSPSRCRCSGASPASRSTRCTASSAAGQSRTRPATIAAACTRG